MTPPNRVRPTDAEVAQIKADIANRVYTARQVAERYGVARQAVYRWIRPPKPSEPSQRLYRWQIDPTGFDAACQSNWPIHEIAKAWECGSKRIRERFIELTGAPRKHLCRSSQDSRSMVITADIRFTQRRDRQLMKQAELAKRARLRAEVERLMEWRMQA